MSTGADVTATFCATLVDEWVRAGLTDAVIAPGSRSAPMALALAGDGRLRLHVHHDERAAGFVALGLGRVAGRPAVVLTTSGTATAELHPAIVEAHQDHVPMLALTADRPPELHGVGAPQTIDQRQLYGAAVRWFADPGVPDDGARDRWRSLAARAVLGAIGSPPGPVQLNLAFREPLIGEPDTLPVGRKGGGPWHGVPASAHALPAALDAEALAAGWEGARGVFIAGAGIERPDLVHALAEQLRWPVVADPRSGCRLPRRSTVSHADAILRSPAQARRLRPEVVVRLGALPASKIVVRWLSDLVDAWQIGVAPHGRRSDPNGDLSALLVAEPGAFCAAVLQAQADRDPVPPSSSDRVDTWYQRWLAADAEAAAAIADVLSNHPEPTEPAIAREVVAALPSEAHLLVSSSMPVRDVEWYAVPRDGLTVHANRGANGIDGVVATGIGIALGASTPTAVLVGDVAFLYDATALVGAARRGIDLTVVVVDNDGGGIFSFLPQAAALDADRFELLFGTPHGVDLAALATALGATVTPVDRQADLQAAVAGAAALGGVHVVIVRTHRSANVAVHDDLHRAVVAALEPT